MPISVARTTVAFRYGWGGSTGHHRAGGPLRNPQQGGRMLTDLLRKPLNVGHALALLVVGVVVGGGAFAVAAIPGPDGKIKACLKKSGATKGAVRVISHNKKCSRSERTLTWNVKGARGLPGAAGQDGQRGAEGIQGPKGDQGVPGPA